MGLRTEDWGLRQARCRSSQFEPKLLLTDIHHIFINSCVVQRRSADVDQNLLGCMVIGILRWSAGGAGKWQCHRRDFKHMQGLYSVSICRGIGKLLGESSYSDNIAWFALQEVFENSWVMSSCQNQWQVLWETAGGAGNGLGWSIYCSWVRNTTYINIMQWISTKHTRPPSWPLKKVKPIHQYVYINLHIYIT